MPYRLRFETKVPKPGPRTLNYTHIRYFCGAESALHAVMLESSRCFDFQQKCSKSPIETRARHSLSRVETFQHRVHRLWSFTVILNKSYYGSFELMPYAICVTDDIDAILSVFNKTIVPLEKCCVLGETWDMHLF